MVSGQRPLRLPLRAMAGVIAGAAYVVAQEIDLRLCRRNTDDLALLGGVVVGHRRRARALGLGAHLAFSALLGELYGRAVYPRYERHPIRSAVALITAEHLAGFPLCICVDRFHPWSRSGRLDRYWTLTGFLQATWRHAIFGVTLGYATRWLARR